MVNSTSFEDDKALLVATLDALMISDEADDIAEIVKFLEEAKTKYPETRHLMEEELSGIVAEYLSLYVPEAERMSDPTAPPEPSEPHFGRRNKILELDVELREKGFGGVISEPQEPEMWYFHLLNLCGYFKESAYDEFNAAKAFSFGLLYLIRNFRNHYKVDLPSKADKFQSDFEKRVVGSNKNPGPYNRVRINKKWKHESTEIIIHEIPRGLPSAIRDDRLRPVIRATIDTDFKDQLRQRGFDEPAIDKIIYRTQNMINEIAKSERVSYMKKEYKYVWR